MIRYDINFNRLALAIVPLCLRKPILMNILYVMMGQVSRALGVFSLYRDETNYRLAYNGQVCYLRAVLNDKYDELSRRIYIEDVEPMRGNILYMREKNDFLMAPTRSTGEAITINKRDFSGSNAVDFNVVVPLDLQGTFKEEQMRALVDTYKLASKRYTITYR